MKLVKRLLVIHLAATALYIASYCVLLNRKPPWNPMGYEPRKREAHYIGVWDDADYVVRTLYYPLEVVDQSYWPERWQYTFRLSDYPELERLP